MGAAKIIGLFFLIIIIILGVIGVDIYLTINAFADVDPADLVSNPQFENVNNESIIISVDVDLPKAGFIPKAVIITLILDIDGTEIQDTDKVNFGESTTLDITLTLDENSKQSLVNGSPINLDLKALVTPAILGISLGFAEQDVSLGSHTINP